MTFLEMQTYLQFFLGETTPAWFPLAMQKEIINRSYMEIRNDITKNNENYFATSGTINWVAGTELYTLPTNTRILSVERTDNNPLPRPLRQIDLSQRTVYLNQYGAGASVFTGAMPGSYYYLLGNQIGFLPVPTTAATAVVRIFYVPTVTKLVADADVLPLEWPDDYQEVIPFGAYLRAMVRDKEAYNFNRPHFDRLRQQVLEFTSIRVSQEPEMVVDTDREF